MPQIDWPKIIRLKNPLPTEYIHMRGPLAYVKALDQFSKEETERLGYTVSKAAILIESSKRVNPRLRELVEQFSKAGSSK